MSGSIVPFEIAIPQDEVQRLKRKLQDTRLPPTEIVPGAAGNYGPSYQWASDLYHAWLNDFDWYEHQKQMNTAPHFKYTHQDGLKIHFLHLQSSRDNAIPLMMLHGWPGSFYEFNRVWGPLAEPSDAHEPAFHVVVPSLPGFAFSDWPPRARWTLQDTADVLDSLMKELGYAEYVMQGFWKVQWT